MKPNLNTTLITLALGFGLHTAKAQTPTPLPYATNFDSPAQKAGWVEHRKGSTKYYRWVFTPIGAPSAPDCLYHDYPVGSDGSDSTVDWYVSPMFRFPAGGMLDSIKVNVYAIMGSATADDEFGIYLLKGSADPAGASSVTRLADLTPMVSNAFSLWKDTGKFEIPPTTDDCYIALKYKAKNNWFTLKADNIRIKGNPVSSIPENGGQTEVINLSPNPATNRLSIRYTAANPQLLRLRIYQMTGALAYGRELDGPQTLNIDLPSGIYIYKIYNTKDQELQAGKLAIRQ